VSILAIPLVLLLGILFSLLATRFSRGTQPKLTLSA
jgi:hypothetical protein